MVDKLNENRTERRQQRRLIAVLAFVVVVLGTTIPAAPAMAAGTASVSISPSTASVAAGASTTLTLSITCGVTGGCAGTTLTFPVTTYTDLTGTSVNDSAKFGNLSCPGWTKTATSSLVTYEFTGGSPAGTVATGTSQCTMTYATTNFSTPNGQTFTLTPTINGSNFTSSVGSSSTVTVTATHNIAFSKGAPAQAGSGAALTYTLVFDCRGAGSIGMGGITITDTLPANFTYTGYSTYYNANNGNGSYASFPGTITVPTAGSNTFTYSDPTGTVCRNTTYPSRDIFISGTATTGGVADAAGSKITNTASASWSYLDGTSGSNPGVTVSSNVIAPVPTNFLSKAGAGQNIGNVGQYRFPPNNAAYTYTYPGNWNGTGQSVEYAIRLATNGSGANAAFAVQDPLPCQTTTTSPGTAANPNFSSNAPGTLCASPAVIPTLITASGFTPTVADAITVIHTDGSTATIPYTSAKGWVIPASLAVAEIDFPPFAEEGANTTTVVFNVLGYAPSGLPTMSLLTNTATATAFPVGSATPLVPTTTASGAVLVVSPTQPSGTVIEPGIWPQYSGGSTCTESVPIGEFGGGGPQPNRIEVAQAPSQAIYLSFLAPADSTVTAGSTQSFTFSTLFGGGAGPFTASAIAATTTLDYNGTGRTLLQYVIPAGTITQPGTYSFKGTGWTVNLGPGCAGSYQNDITIGYGAPITGCVDPGGVTPPSKGVNNALTTTNAPNANNYCGESRNIVVAPINPGFSVDKSVQGNLDATPVTGGGVGNVSPNGGTASYKVTFANTGATNLVDPVMYDLLPAVGDTNNTNLSARSSQYGVALTGIGPVPAGVTVSYSTTANPCRPEVLATNPGCVNGWTTTQPPLASVTALKFAFTGTVFVAGTARLNSFTVPYTVSTPANIAGKTAWNTVGTTATPGVGQTPMTAAESSRTGLAAQSASPLLTKQATPTTVNAPGQVVTYTFGVTNNTAVSLTNVSVQDTQTAPAGALTSGPTCPQPTLAPGATENCTATYVVTQADIDAGGIQDTATATGTPGLGSPLVSAPATAAVTATQAPALTVVKSASPATVTLAGQTVTYSFLVTNTGNVTLASVQPIDTSFTGTGALSAISCPTSTLAPGASTTCTATYQVTQADLDAGSVTNTAIVTGTPLTGGPVSSAPSSATVAASQTPSLSIVKSASPSSAAALTVGQLITYSFAVTNTGNVSLSQVAVNETAFSGSGTLSAPSCPGTTLQAGAQMICTATYTLTQADVDSGSLTNAATATGVAPSGPISSPPSSFAIPAPQDPGLTVVKTASPSTVTTAGQTVTYSFDVTNSGTVTMSNVTVDEASFTGNGTLSAITCPAGTTSMVPGASVTCTATYQVTQADIDAGSITNTATATGTPPTGPAFVSPAATATVTVAQTPTLTIVKTAAPAVVSFGQTVNYSFLITNAGNVTMTNVTPTEISFTGTGALSAISCPTGTLAPGDSTTCTASYQITQADVDAGSVTNTAAATATPPTGPPYTSPTSSATVTSAATPGLSVVKTASTARASSVGQVVTYSFAMTNTGNVTLTSVQPVEGTFTGTGALSAINCPAGAASLAPGASVTCTATYRVTSADLRSGTELSNTATATATAPAGPPVVAPASVADVTMDPPPVGLPVTGVNPANTLLLGAVLLLFGGVVRFARRRRRLQA